MAEDVNVDVDAAIKEFCDAVYGAAADDIIGYLRETDALCKTDPGYFRFFYDPLVMRRVLHTPANLIRWQRLFDRMEAKVANDPRALFNVRRARINLDAVTALRYNTCAKADPDFARETSLGRLRGRYERYVIEDADVEFRSASSPLFREEHVKMFLNAVRLVHEFQRREQRYPEELVDRYGAKNLFTLMPAPDHGLAPAVWSDRCASGFAVRIPVPTPAVTIIDQEISVGFKDGLPWNNVVYKPLRKSFLTAADLKKIRSSKEYQLIYIGCGRLTESGMLRLTMRSHRQACFFLGEFFEPEDFKREYDFYLSIKNEGKTLLVDRLVLAKRAGK